MPPLNHEVEHSLFALTHIESMGRVFDIKTYHLLIILYPWFSEIFFSQTAGPLRQSLRQIYRSFSLRPQVLASRLRQFRVESNVCRLCNKKVCDHIMLCVDE